MQKNTITQKKYLFRNLTFQTTFQCFFDKNLSVYRKFSVVVLEDGVPVHKNVKKYQIWSDQSPKNRTMFRYLSHLFNYDRLDLLSGYKNDLTPSECKIYSRSLIIAYLWSCTIENVVISQRPVRLGDFLSFTIFACKNHATFNEAE